MIRPPGWDGVAFSERSDGDLRNDPAARAAASRLLGIDESWAETRQIHGNRVVRVDEPGGAGAADAMWTTEPGLPLAIFTADCFGVALGSSGAVGVAHAGWRGAAEGVVANLRDEMTAAGYRPDRAGLGPGIGACCFEVGDEVAARFGGDVTETTWGTVSVDLPSVVAGQLTGLQTWSAGGCTRHEDRWFSHRGTATSARMATLGWLQ